MILNLSLDLFCFLLFCCLRIVLLVLLQKMAALKRAYAEIILNTAKEAAARILVSERKAVSLQQDLHNSKEEALRMLLRMKQMMESKVLFL